MRWRFTDRIEQFEPWARIKGRKSVSLEEYSLLRPFGRDGVFPEALVVESCVHLARWLVVRSSDFRQSGLLARVTGFSFESQTGMGDALTMVLTVQARRDETLELTGEVLGSARCVGRGDFALELTPLADLCDPEDLKAVWQELYAPAN